MTGHNYILPDKNTEKRDLRKKPLLTGRPSQKPPEDPVTELVQRIVRAQAEAL